MNEEYEQRQFWKTRWIKFSWDDGKGWCIMSEKKYAELLEFAKFREEQEHKWLYGK